MDPLWAPFGRHEVASPPGQDTAQHASVKSIDTFGVQAREPVAPPLLNLLKTQSIGPAEPA